ncbi:hypothetical protein [Pedobacter heparinus]|uniref:hypothetical protein n=1 Tax=Pedobacter heparinus TaxID=984 RepID=UPI00292F02B1|nr:hypothetical protein [Pedobacter heparinus]
MKTVITILFMLLSMSVSYAGFNGSFKVNGDSDKFYPVTFVDGAWDNNIPTELYLGRSSIHTDAIWLGSLMSKFVFHVSLGGHKSNFINADIRQSEIVFIAGWKDATANSGDNKKIIIWLKGGGITYYYNSNFEVSPAVYDGVSNTLPFNEPSAYDPAGTDHTFKTTLEQYVNTQGISHEYNAYFNGQATNFFAGKVGIGTTTPTEKLSVNGKIRAHEIKVETANWPDYVFTKDYQLLSLQQTEQHIKEKGHLPGIPSAAEAKSNGIDLGEMNAKLLQKIEELTLHLIEQNKKIEMQSSELSGQKKLIEQLINYRK